MNITKSIAGDIIALKETNIGHVGNLPIDSVTNTPEKWAALPVGYSSMMSNAIGIAGGLPENNNGYFTKLTNRDSNGGWTGIFVIYSTLSTLRRTYFGQTINNTSFATWDQILTLNTVEGADMNISAGTWSAAPYATSGLSSAILANARWQKTGKMLDVWGGFIVDPIAQLTNCSITIPGPSGITFGTSGYSGTIIGSGVTNAQQVAPLPSNRIYFAWGTSTANSNTIQVTFKIHL